MPRNPRVRRVQQKFLPKGDWYHFRLTADGLRIGAKDFVTPRLYYAEKKLMNLDSLEPILEKKRTSSVFVG